MTAIDQLVAALSAIVEEVAGPDSRSAASFLPPHLIHDARPSNRAGRGES